MAYLDETGLARFWYDIKQWIASALSNLVHRTGDETIDGLKTFVSSESVPAGESSVASQITEVLISNPTISKGTETQDRNAYTQLVFTDSSQDRDSGRVMSVFYKHPSETDSKPVAHFALDYINNSNVSRRAELLLGYDVDNDTPYATVPATSSSRTNATDIVTRGWIASDTRIVHTTGNEDIYGKKSFYNVVDVVTSNGIHKHVWNTAVTKGTLPATQQSFWMTYNGSSGSTANDSFVTNFIGLRTDGETVYRISVARNDLSSDWLELDLVHAADGTKYATLPSTPATGRAGDIVTRDFIASDSRIVHTTGDENIAGTKVFTDDAWITNIYPILNLKDTSVARGTAPSNNFYNVFCSYWDKDGNRFGGLYHKYFTTQQNALSLICYSGLDTSSTNFTELSVGYSANGNPYATCVTPEDNSNSTDIATTAWVRRYCETTKNFVPVVGPDSAGNYSIGGFGFLTLDTNYSTTVAPTAAKFSSVNVYFSEHQRRGMLEWAWRANSTDCDVKLAVMPYNSASALVVLLSRRSSVDCFSSQVDNTLYLGSSNLRWKQLFAVTTTISTSDERLKSSISGIPDNVLDAWADLDFLQFQFIDAVEEKGGGARLHTGMVAQRIDEAFRVRGLDASRYGLFCYDRWDAVPEDRDADGNATAPAQPAGDRYSLRYEEALCMEAAYMRRENARLKKRVADLEERLAALELKIA